MSVTRGQCDARPTVTFPAARHQRPLASTNVLGDRGTLVLTTCPGLHLTAERPGFELATYRSQDQHPNDSATEPHDV